MTDIPCPTRRRFLQATTALLATGWLPPLRLSVADSPTMIRRSIPASGEKIPAIGMGTWITFNVGEDPAARARRVEILRTFFEHGGTVIDSSPMYGSAERVVGHCLDRLDAHQTAFAATKVWTPFQWLGVRQMETSEDFWGVDRMDLMQVHNLVDWESHLETLQSWKADGRLRYIGVTTSHGRRHQELAGIMASQPIDCVQFTYNLLDREAEQRLLPMAAERGLAVIINRPFQGGRLFDRFQNRPLPDWAAEFDCQNWAQFFLKFVISHTAVTCAIPATSQVEHMQENMGALYGRLPDQELRRRMVDHIAGL